MQKETPEQLAEATTHSLMLKATSPARVREQLVGMKAHGRYGYTAREIEAICVAIEAAVVAYEATPVAQPAPRIEVTGETYPSLADMAARATAKLATEERAEPTPQTMR